MLRSPASYGSRVMFLYLWSRPLLKLRCLICTIPWTLPWSTRMCAEQCITRSIGKCQLSWISHLANTLFIDLCKQQWKLTFYIYFLHLRKRPRRGKCLLIWQRNANGLNNKFTAAIPKIPGDFLALNGQLHLAKSRSPPCFFNLATELGSFSGANLPVAESGLVYEENYSKGRRKQLSWELRKDFF